MHVPHFFLPYLKDRLQDNGALTHVKPALGEAAKARHVLEQRKYIRSALYVLWMYWWKIPNLFEFVWFESAQTCCEFVC
jgi:hypothetical protein